jgi:PKD repeat protein
MKKVYMFLLAAALSTALNAQTTFWIENFNNGCTSGCDAGSYSGPNGTWAVSTTGSTSTAPNQWFVSCAENGRAAGQCGQTCGADATLHVGANPNSECTCWVCNDPSGDCGAAYDACSLGILGQSCGNTDDAHTDVRAESPVIDCSSRTTISITFNYLEGGQNTIDNATLWYYDGAAWSQIADMPKTTLCGQQGRWGSFTQALPASADNNPSVKIGFRWVNNSDDNGTDPSFAADSVRLTVPQAGAAPTANFTQGNTQACDSVCVTYTDSSTLATSWSWSFPGGTPSTSTQQNPTVCYTTPGSYDVTQIVTNTFGSDTLLKSNLVTITQTPVAHFISSNITLCIGDCVDFTDQSTGVVQSYVWSFQGAIPASSSVQNPTNICYFSADSFDVSLTVMNGNCINASTHVNSEIVTQAQQPVISMNSDTMISSSAITYQWYQVGVGALPSGMFQYYIASPFQSYYVCITDLSGCSSCSDTITYMPEGVHELSLSDAFQVFPNPAHGKITINNSSKIEKSMLQLLDASGRLVKKESVFFVHDKAEISIEDLAKGNYMLQLLDNKQQVIFSTQLMKN